MVVACSGLLTFFYNRLKLPSHPKYICIYPSNQLIEVLLWFMKRCQDQIKIISRNFHLKRRFTFRNVQLCILVLTVTSIQYSSIPPIPLNFCWTGNPKTLKWQNSLYFWPGLMIWLDSFYACLSLHTSFSDTTGQQVNTVSILGYIGNNLQHCRGRLKQVILGPIVLFKHIL